MRLSLFLCLASLMGTYAAVGWVNCGAGMCPVESKTAIWCHCCPNKLLRGAFLADVDEECPECKMHHEDGTISCVSCDVTFEEEDGNKQEKDITCTLPYCPYITSTQSKCVKCC